MFLAHYNFKLLNLQLVTNPHTKSTTTMISSTVHTSPLELLQKIKSNGGNQQITDLQKKLTAFVSKNAVPGKSSPIINQSRSVSFCKNDTSSLDLLKVLMAAQP